MYGNSAPQAALTARAAASTADDEDPVDLVSADGLGALASGYSQRRADGAVDQTH